MTPAADAPAGLVRGDDRRVADLLAEFLVGRRGVAGGAVEQAGETARGDVEVERVAQQVGDLRQRDAHLGVHFDHEADDAGAELYAGRTQRVGGLQGVSALHPPPALRAVPDLDIETPHKGAHLRQFFLILRRHPGHFNRAAAVRTRRRRRRREGLVDLFRARPAALPTVACASPPPGTPAATLRPVLGKGGCLSAAGPPRLVELLLEAFAATLPSVPVAGGARQFTTQPADLAVLLLDALVRRITLAPGRLRTAKSAALASHTARIGTCAPNLHTTSRIFSLLPGKQRQLMKAGDGDPVDELAALADQRSRPLELVTSAGPRPVSNLPASADEFRGSAAPRVGGRCTHVSTAAGRGAPASTCASRSSRRHSGSDNGPHV